jgi:anti-anti-sigma regulatory factor
MTAPEDGPAGGDAAGGSEHAVVLHGVTAPEDVAALCARVCAVLADGDADVVCDVRAVRVPDLAWADALARLQLTLRRRARRLRLRGASPALRQLLCLAGLDAVLGIEPWGEPEQREVPLGVEEGVEADDLPL